ncbi:NYN domain-containing protein [Actinomadura monticuli]|uniref:NYN domain-containing protein n=1 Tax=Actinomadura monticuli TaxID=3097367 RepID=A0ABV4QE45_9ACTN
MPDAIAYVDGFNLYHGLKSKYGRAYLWLDIVQLVQRMRRDDTVRAVKYFTAIVKGEPDAARRQETYLAALTAHRPQVQVIRGHFKVKNMRISCRACGAQWQCRCQPPQQRYRTYEEKLTDVALATEMVRDAALGNGELSLLVSTDTDFLPAIQASLELAPTRPILVACPPGRGSPSRFDGMVTSFPIREEHLKASLLPDSVPDKGLVRQRPDKWA